MSEKVLVAYATRYGSTREVADAVGATLREGGAAVDVRPAKDVADLREYRAVVLGAPFYVGSMLKHAAQFLERHRSDLSNKPVAVFALGPVRASDDMDEARVQLDKGLAKFEWLNPVATAMFVGAYDPKRLRSLDKLVAVLPASPLHGVGEHDDRDWSAIRAWSVDLAKALETSTTPATIQ